MILADVFTDEEAAARIGARLTLASDAFASVLQHVRNSPDADKCIANLDRWLSAAGDVGPRIELLASNPALCHRICFLLGASQALSDVLVQNPELGLLLSDSETLGASASVEELIGEGRRLLSGSISFTHSLDRIRYLKQRHLIKLVWNDLSGTWEPPQVWRAISTLADVVLRLTAELVWQDCGGSGQLPVAIIAMGKHGTNELNYSSDIDLIFDCDDGADIALATKFCEKYTRALEGKMGRGSLYRIDLRLRPLGVAGPLVHTLTSALTYYQSYCEPWEILAILKARVCAGDFETGGEFIRATRAEVFKDARSEMFLESVADSKKRYETTIRESGQDESHIKLGPGAIRDIEFLVQMHQLMLGHVMPELQGAATLDALRILSERGRFAARKAGFLADSYTLFRQVEHRIQLRDDLQSHSLPTSEGERAVLARLIGAASWSELGADLHQRRAEVRAMLEEAIPSLGRHQPVDSHAASELLGFDDESPAALALNRLLAGADDNAALLSQLAGDSDMRERLALICTKAPRIAKEIGYHPELWDVAFGEEVEHIQVDEADLRVEMKRRVGNGGGDFVGSLSASLRREYAAAGLKEAYHSDVTRTFSRLTAIAETALLALLDSVGGEDIDVVGLGRLGSEELLLPSDWDVVLLVGDDVDHSRAERIGEEWLRDARKVAMTSGYFPIDIRLRPEGGKGLVVRTFAGFAQYAETALETWERLAITRGRSLRGRPETHAVLIDAMHHRAWGWDEETEILAMRDRIHSERLHPWERNRDLKIGEGFIMDIEWLCSIMKLRHPELASETRHTIGFVHRLGELGMIGAVEATELMSATLLFCRVRNAMFLLDMDSDSLLPENPQKLDRLASALDVQGGNVLLSQVEDERQKVSQTFAELVGRG